MDIKIQKEFLRIKKSKFNNYVNSEWDIYLSEIKINNVWYPCKVLCFENHIEIYDPRKLNPITKDFDQPIYGLYKKIKTPYLKNQLIKYLLDKHFINIISNKVIEEINEHKRIILRIGMILILVIINYLSENRLTEYISSNNLIQSIIKFFFVINFVDFLFQLKKTNKKENLEEILMRKIEEDVYNKENEENASY